MPAALKRIPAWPIVVLAVVAYLGLRALTHPASYDLQVYRDEGLAVRHGINLYGPLPGVPSLATYPPFAGILFVALTLIPVGILIPMVLAANLALIYLVVRLSMRLVGAPTDRNAVLIAGSIAIFSEPVLTTLRFGQINLALLALVLWDFTRPRSRWSGTGIGLAAGLKVTPAIFIAYLLLTRRYRAAATAAATFAATILGATALLPRASIRYWTSGLFDISRVGRVENAANQTLRGMFVRMDHTRSTAPGELLIIGLVLIAGLLCARAAYRRLGDQWGVPACAVTGLLTAPIAWTHHWVWCIPIAVLLWQEMRNWLPAVAIFWSYAVWFVPHTHSVELHYSTLEFAASNWYVLFGIGFLLLVATRVLSTPRRLAIPEEQILASLVPAP